MQQLSKGVPVLTNLFSQYCYNKLQLLLIKLIVIISTKLQLTP